MANTRVQYTLNQSIHHIYLSPRNRQNTIKTTLNVNKHGNGLPEKPAAHQSSRPHDNFIMINIKKEQRPTQGNGDKHRQDRQKGR